MDTLFEMDNSWEEEWKDMPEYSMHRIKPIRTLKIQFKNEEDLEKFSELINQKISKKYDTYWFPKLNETTTSKKVFVDEP